MTLREIDIAMSAIGRRQNREYSLEASFHGIKIDLDEDSTDEPNPMTPAQEAAFAHALDEAKSRVKREAAERV